LAEYWFKQEHRCAHAFNNNAVPASHVAHHARLANRAHDAHNKTASIVKILDLEIHVLN
jgi:hypothetical protein